jgi:hypothetical protein
MPDPSKAMDQRMRAIERKIDTLAKRVENVIATVDNVAIQLVDARKPGEAMPSLLAGRACWGRAPRTR